MIRDVGEFTVASAEIGGGRLDLDLVISNTGLVLVDFRPVEVDDVFTTKGDGLWQRCGTGRVVHDAVSASFSPGGPLGGLFECSSGAFCYLYLSQRSQSPIRSFAQVS